MGWQWGRRKRDGVGDGVGEKELGVGMVLGLEKKQMGWEKG